MQSPPEPPTIRFSYSFPCQFCRERVRLRQGPLGYTKLAAYSDRDHDCAVAESEILVPETMVPCGCGEVVLRDLWGNKRSLDPADQRNHTTCVSPRSIVPNTSQSPSRKADRPAPSPPVRSRRHIVPGIS